MLDVNGVNSLATAQSRSWINLGSLNYAVRSSTVLNDSKIIWKFWFWFTTEIRIMIYSFMTISYTLLAPLLKIVTNVFKLSMSAPTKLITTVVLPTLLLLIQGVGFRMGTSQFLVEDILLIVTKSPDFWITQVCIGETAAQIQSKEQWRVILHQKWCMPTSSNKSTNQC